MSGRPGLPLQGLVVAVAAVVAAVVVVVEVVVAVAGLPVMQDEGAKGRCCACRLRRPLYLSGGASWVHAKLDSRYRRPQLGTDTVPLVSSRGGLRCGDGVSGSSNGARAALDQPQGAEQRVVGQGTALLDDDV